jgi:hypothetical protein
VKLPKPAHPKRKGRLVMRGAEGFERSISFRAYWENVNRAEMLYQVERTFRSLVNESYRVRPTLYTRFTFTVSHVLTTLTAGSPKVLGSEKRSVQAWFYSSGLSYSIAGAVERCDEAADGIDRTIRNARLTEFDEDQPDAQFFLEFITCRAYVVKP